MKPDDYDAIPEEILDVIGPWSELKIEIVRNYFPAYTTILTRQRDPAFRTVYIDGFAGTGFHRSKESGELVPGSPQVALDTHPPFGEFHFVDSNEEKVNTLKRLSANHTSAEAHHGDANAIVPSLLERCRYEDYARAICFLDPYSLQVDWKVIEKIGSMKSVELFLNFPVHDVNRNALRRDPARVTESSKDRMTRFWGDESWMKIGYETNLNLFGVEERVKVENETLAEAFRQRLETRAGFAHVPKPMPMRNSNRAIVFYLYFASHKPVAGNIVRDIFGKYRKKGYR